MAAGAAAVAVAGAAGVVSAVDGAAASGDSAARLRARWAATCERVAHRSEQKRRQQFDDVSRYTLPQRSSAQTPKRALPYSHSQTANPQTAPAMCSAPT